MSNFVLEYIILRWGYNDILSLQGYVTLSWVANEATRESIDYASQQRSSVFCRTAKARGLVCLCFIDHQSHSSGCVGIKTDDIQSTVGRGAVTTVGEVGIRGTKKKKKKRERERRSRRRATQRRSC